MYAARERSASLTEALSTVREAFATLDLRTDVVSCGPHIHGVFECTVTDDCDTVVADSAGKGGGLQSTASALFEAWEHYWSYMALDWLRETDVARALPAAEVAAQPALVGDHLVRRLAADYPDAMVGCLRFDGLDGLSSIHYPVFAKTPAFLRFLFGGDTAQYRPYARYATTNGTASGMTRDDALLHALLELVERDAMSFALLDWYAGGGPRARRIDATSLPEDVVAGLELTAELFDGVPVLLDVTTDLGVPVVCALPPREMSPIPNTFGAGASLTPAYAVERAIGELVQFRLVNDDAARAAAHRRALDNVARWPLIERCTRQDPTPVIAAATPVVEPVDWVPALGPVPAQLADLRGRLAAAGLDAYVLRIDPDTPVPVMCVVVPGLEAFFMARQGIPVLPTGRANARVVAA